MSYGETELGKRAADTAVAVDVIGVVHELRGIGLLDVGLVVAVLLVASSPDAAWVATPSLHFDDLTTAVGLESEDDVLQVPIQVDSSWT